MSLSQLVANLLAVKEPGSVLGAMLQRPFLAKPEGCQSQLVPSELACAGGSPCPNPELWQVAAGPDPTGAEPFCLLQLATFSLLCYLLLSGGFCSDSIYLLRLICNKR